MRFEICQSRRTIFLLRNLPKFLTSTNDKGVPTKMIMNSEKFFPTYPSNHKMHDEILHVKLYVTIQISDAIY